MMLTRSLQLRETVVSRRKEALLLSGTRNFVLVPVIEEFSVVVVVLF